MLSEISILIVLSYQNMSDHEYATAVNGQGIKSKMNLLCFDCFRIIIRLTVPYSPTK